MNKIAEFSHLDHLSGVMKELWLNWNKLEDTASNRDYLAKFKILETLYLADNPVSNVDDYQQMIMERVPHLKQLDGNMLRKG